MNSMGSNTMNGSGRRSASGNDRHGMNVPKRLINQKEGVKPWVAIALMIGITIVLAGILHMWVGSLCGSDEDAAVHAQEIPVDPMTLEIEVKLDVEYKRLGGDLVPFYDMEYRAVFGFETTSGPSVTFIPLPDATIESLSVAVDGKPVDIPEIKSGDIVLHFQENAEKEVEIGYKARGVKEYTHMLPKDRYIRKLDFHCTVDGIKDARSKDILFGSLVPDSKEQSGERMELVWSKQNAVLKRDIHLSLPSEKDPLDSLGLFYLMVGLIICGELLIFYWGMRRLNRKTKYDLFVYMCAPFFVGALVVTLSLLYVGELFAAVSSAVLVTAMLFTALRFFVSTEKGLPEMTAIMGMVFAVLPAGMFLTSQVRIITVSVLIIGLVVTVPLFMKRYRRKVPEIKTETNLSQQIYENRQLEKKVGNIMEKNASLAVTVEELKKDRDRAAAENAEIRKEMESRAGKNYCPLCGRDIGEDFDYCPGCGKGLGGTVKCGKCGLMMSESGGYCVNCGDRTGG